MHYKYDIIVIGAGPGGYETAIKAAQIGKKVCVIESSNFGGTCLNVGCIPTKALLKSAAVYREVMDSDLFGVDGTSKERISINFEKVQERKSQVVNQLVMGVRYLLKANGVDIVNGRASFIDERSVCVGDDTISSDDIIIATGSKAAIPAFIKQQGTNHIIDSSQALNLDSLPASINIIGGGVIGIEFAYLFSSFGCKVTVIELMPGILPMIDEEISKLAQKRLQQMGVEFALGAKVSCICNNEVIFNIDGHDKSIKAEATLIAIGRIPNIDGLELDKAGVKTNKGTIVTDEKLMTNIPHIYAIGDVNGKVMLAHAASSEGMVALENICGRECKMSYDKIPSCIYLEPEIAAVGLSEKQAKEQYGNTKVGKFSMASNGKSLIEGNTDGIIKIILEGNTGKLIGAHLYGLHATDLIAEATLAINNSMNAESILNSIHPHPTISEAFHEAVMKAWCGKSINGL